MAKQIGLLIVCITLSVVLSSPFITTFYSNSNIVFASTDTIRPSVAISRPDENAIIYKDKFVVAGKASGLMGIKRVEVRVNNGPYTIAAPSSPGDWSSWSITLDSRSMPIGDNRIVARATDYAGNQNWDEVHIKRAFYDDFSGAPYLLAPGDKSPNGKWYGVWDGSGAFGVKQDQKDSSNNVFYEKTKSVTSSFQTQSALALTTHKFKDFKLSVDVRTDLQQPMHIT